MNVTVPNDYWRTHQVRHVPAHGLSPAMGSGQHWAVPEAHRQVPGFLLRGGRPGSKLVGAEAGASHERWMYRRVGLGKTCPLGVEVGPRAPIRGSALRDLRGLSERRPWRAQRGEGKRCLPNFVPPTRFLFVGAALQEIHDRCSALCSRQWLMIARNSRHCGSAAAAATHETTRSFAQLTASFRHLLQCKYKEWLTDVS